MKTLPNPNPNQDKQTVFGKAFEMLDKAAGYQIVVPDWLILTLLTLLLAFMLAPALVQPVNWSPNWTMIALFAIGALLLLWKLAILIVLIALVVAFPWLLFFLLF